MVTRNRKRGAGKVVARWLLHIALGLAVAVLAYLFIDFVELTSALAGAPLWLVLVLVLVATLDRVLVALKWKLLLKAIGLHPPFIVVVSAYYQAAVVSRLTPSSLGADIFRAYKISQYCGKSWDRILASMTVEKLVGIFAMIALSSAGMAVMTLSVLDIPQSGLLSTLLAVCILIAGGGYWISMRPEWGLIVERFVPWGKLARFLGKLHGSYREYGNKHSVLAVSMGIGLVQSAVQVLILYGAAISVGVTAEPLLLFSILALSHLLRKIGIVFEGVVLGELAVVLTVTLAGIDQNQAVALAVLANAVRLVASSPGLLFWYLERRTARLATGEQS